MEALQTFGAQWPNRLPRGRSYAQAGRVQDLRIGRGQAAARVAGGMARPYRVELRLQPYSDATWQRIVTAAAQEADFAVRLLRGEMPQRMETLLSDLAVPLFPADEGDLESSCTCPDWANPCKHTAAVHYVIGEAMDSDPFLLLEMRGRTRTELLTALQQARAGSDMPAEMVQEDETDAGSPDGFLADSSAEPTPGQVSHGIATVSVDGHEPAVFWRWPDDSGPELSFAIERPDVEVPTLRALGPPPSWGPKDHFTAALQPIYEETSELAEALVRGDAVRPDLPAEPVSWPESDRSQDPFEHPGARGEPDTPKGVTEPVPKLSRVCQTIIGMAMDVGYVQARDKEMLDPGEQKLFRIALEALIAEERLVKTGRGSATRYELTQAD